MTLENFREFLPLVQTVGVIAALTFTAFEVRGRKRELRFRNYLDAISGSLDLSKLMINSSDLHALYDYSPKDLNKSYGDLSAGERARVHYCDLIIALCETVWVANEEGWITPDEWKYWRTWAEQLAQSADFRWTVQWVKDDYDPEFIRELSAVMKMVHSA